jgi:hypothetical protein
MVYYPDFCSVIGHNSEICSKLVILWDRNNVLIVIYDGVIYSIAVLFCIY